MTPHPALAALLSDLARQPAHSPRNRQVREAVRLRAGDACEYCLLPTVGQFQLEHIVPPGLWQEYIQSRLPGVGPQSGRHGPHHLDNFAWACPFCNQGKRERVSHRLGREVYRFFDPRHDRWTDHFAFFHNYLFIVGVTDVGRATVEGLGLNDSRLEGPLGSRHDAILIGQYPPAWARDMYSRRVQKPEPDAGEGS